MSKPQGIVFRRMQSANEVQIALDWAQQEGWNPGHDDAAAFWAADPNGFYLAESDGQPVAAISVVTHNPDYAFLGLYLCLPEWRGQGVGFALWNHALTHTAARTVGLDGVPDQQDNYRKSGFVSVGETRRFEGNLERLTDEPSGVRALQNKDLAKLQTLYDKAQGTPCPGFLQVWLTETGNRQSRVLAFADAPIGMVTWRGCHIGTKIGPLIAPDIQSAKALLAAVRDSGAAAPFVLDDPGGCPELTDLAQTLGMTCSFTTARMYRGPAPEQGPGIRAVATLELG